MLILYLIIFWRSRGPRPDYSDVDITYQYEFAQMLEIWDGQSQSLRNIGR